MRNSPLAIVLALSSAAALRTAAYDPNLKLPYTEEWNLAVEQELGTVQSLTLNYVGSAGRRQLAGASYHLVGDYVHDDVHYALDLRLPANDRWRFGPERS